MSAATAPRIIAAVLAAVLASFCVAGLVDVAMAMGPDGCAGDGCEFRLTCRPEVPPPGPSGSRLPADAASTKADHGAGLAASADAPAGVPVPIPPRRSPRPLASRAPPARA